MFNSVYLSEYQNEIWCTENSNKLTLAEVPQRSNRNSLQISLAIEIAPELIAEVRIVKEFFIWFSTRKEMNRGYLNLVGISCICIYMSVQVYSGNLRHGSAAVVSNILIFLKQLNSSQLTHLMLVPFYFYIW